MCGNCKPTASERIRAARLAQDEIRTLVAGYASTNQHKLDKLTPVARAIITGRS